MSETPPRRTRKKPPQPHVHVRGRNPDEPRGIRELPDNFNQLARGNKLPRRPPAETLRDDRVEALVPAVANRDARSVCDARIERLIAARDQGDREALARGLAEAFRLGLWRGHNIVSFDVLLQDVVGLRVSEGRELAEEGARLLGSPLRRADDRVIATWFRTEAALLAGGASCRMEVTGEGAEERVVITLPAERADLWLAEVGKRVVAITKFLPRAPEPRRRDPRRT
jgi:hypothetical protein